MTDLVNPIIVLSALATLVIFAFWVRNDLRGYRIGFLRPDEKTLSSDDLDKLRQATISQYLETTDQKIASRDLDKPLTRTSSFAEIGAAMIRLQKAAKGFQPDCIFGINRGGAIVGGMLAKQQGNMLVNILAVDARTAKPTVLESVFNCPVSPKRILLADDGYYKGKHMLAALEYLKDKYLGAKIQALVLLELEQDTPGAFNAPRPTELYSACRTLDHRVKLPWDPI